MLVKRGDGKILNIIKEGDEKHDDDKIRKILSVAKNIAEDSNKIASTIEAEKK